jgi:hypothetical protein
VPSSGQHVYRIGGRRTEYTEVRHRGRTPSREWAGGAAGRNRPRRVSTSGRVSPDRQVQRVDRLAGHAEPHDRAAHGVGQPPVFVLRVDHRHLDLLVEGAQDFQLDEVARVFARLTDDRRQLGSSHGCEEDCQGYRLLMVVTFVTSIPAYFVFYAPVRISPRLHHRIRR